MVVSVAGAEMTGQAMLAMADEWVARNPEAWGRMVAIARGFAAEGRRFSMETLFQHARYRMATEGTSQGFKMNNNTRSALARRLVEQEPGLARFVERRRSKVDWA